LVRRKVAVIVAISPAAALAAKAATTSIPIVFAVAGDPVRFGLVASLARPGGNATGINFFLSELHAKRLELLRELVPAAARVAVLVNPSNAVDAVPNLREVEAAAQAMGLQIRVLNAAGNHEINVAFATFARERPDALFVVADPLFISRRVQLTHLASRHAIPATYSTRDFPEAGGLMSYGTNVTDAWRQAGAYAGRILKGAKTVELPVVQSTKFELVINAETARMLGLEVPTGSVIWTTTIGMLRLPPGLLRLGTRPSSTGSPTEEKTIGIVEVAALAAKAAGGPPAAKRSVTGKPTSSAASAGKRS
jgi:ABC-type uncharacterized transport system substrate-binding protein